MKKTKKIVALALAAVMLVSATVAVTVAYLQSTDSVTNTFTVGKVEIILNEAPVDADGKETTGDRVKENSYKLYPGKEYDKDPTVFVDDESEDCYVFVEVLNGIEEIEDATNTIEDQILANGWKLLSGNVYYYTGKSDETNYNANGAIVSKGAELVVFEKFKIASDVDNTELARYATNEEAANPVRIEINAYAVQEETFATAAAAWNATFGA